MGNSVSGPSQARRDKSVIHERKAKVENSILVSPLFGSRRSQIGKRDDRARIEQVFWNVLKNAQKFTPEGGTISLRSFNEGQRKGIV